ncbi:MAG: PAS domain-containing protein [Pseudomonadales bacterium]
MLKGEVIGDTPHETVQAISTCHDITELRGLQNYLLTREQDIEALTDSVADAIFKIEVVDEATFLFQSVNQSFYRVTGLKPSQVIGKPLQAIYGGATLERVTEHFQRAMRERTSVKWSGAARYPMGIRTGETTVTPVFDETGRRTYLVGSAHDITEHIEALETVRRTGNELRIVLDTLGEGVLRFDKDGIILDSNPAANRLLGLSLAEMKHNGEDIRARVRKGDGERTFSYHELPTISAIRTGQPKTNVEMYVPRPDGSYLFALVNAYPIRNSKGDIDGAVTSFLDITERKKRRMPSKPRCPRSGV